MDKDDARPLRGEPTNNISATGGKTGGNFDFEFPVDEYEPWGTFNKHVCDDKPCIRGGFNDGKINIHTGEVKAYPCHNKNCPRHWKNYSHITAPRLVANLPDKTYWVHLRLTSPVRLKSQDNIKAFVKLVLVTYTDAHLTTFAHRGHKDHYHVLLGTNQQPDKDTLKDHWRKVRPGKRAFPKWSGQWFFFEDFDHPANLIWYCFLGKKDQPRTRPPWKDLPMKYPYRQYGTIKT